MGEKHNSKHLKNIIGVNQGDDGVWNDGIEHGELTWLLWGALCLYYQQEEGLTYL